MRPLLALLVVASTLAGCDALGLGGWASPGRAVAGNDRAALDAARARWEAAGMGDYRYRFERGPCECGPDAYGPFEVTVRDGAVVEVRQRGEVLEDARFPTVEGWFDEVEATLDAGRQVGMTYERARGFPVEIGLDLESLPMDGGLLAEITGFEPLGD